MKNSIKKFSDALDKSAILLFITTLLTTAFIGLIVLLLVTKGIVGTYDLTPSLWDTKTNYQSDISNITGKKND